MQSKAATVAQYLAELAPDRRAALAAVRKVVLANLDPDIQEGIQYGMIGYYLPHDVYPPGYHCDPKQPLPFAGLAAQKNHLALYLMCLYGHAAHVKWFEQEWAKSGKKLDMGKACLRFKKIEDLALDVIGKAIRRVSAKKFVEHYESVIKTTKKKASPTGGIARKPAKGVKRAKTPRSRSTDVRKAAVDASTS